MKCKSSDSFYGWVVLGTLFIFGLALMPMMMTFSLILPTWVEELGWSRGLISGAGSMRSVLVGLASPIVGILIMRIGAKRAIVIGNSINVVALLLMSFMSQLWHLYVCYGLIFGMGFAIGGMLGSMTILNNWFSMKRSLALAINGGAAGIGGVVINPTLMALIENIGWRNTYLIVACAALICCVIVPAIFLVNAPEDLGQVPDGPVKPKVKKEKEGKKAPPAIYRTPVDFTAGEAMRTKTLWFLIAYNSLQMIAMAGLMTHQIAFLFDLGIPPVMAAMAGGIMSAVMSVATLVVGILGLRYNMHKLAMGSMLLTISGMVILLFTKNMTMVAIYSTMFGLGFGIQRIALGTLFPNYFGIKEFPKIMGYMMPFNAILGGVGSPVAGFIRDSYGTYIPFFEISLIFLVLAFICILFAKPPVHPSLKTATGGT